MFLILDCWDNFEYFKLNPKGKKLKPQLSLPVRLVGLRLDKIEKANDSGHAEVAAREIAKLRRQIAALPKVSVVIKEGIVEQISELPLSVGFVKQEETLIRAAQSNHYWDKTDTCEMEDALDELTIHLGPLMKFREQQTGPGPTQLDLKDEIHRKEMVEFGPQHEAVSISRYREMVEAMIAELTAHNPILQKLKNGQNVSAEEALELTELLHAEHPHITENLLRQAYQNHKARFIQFILHILGIETLKSFPETISEAFDQFIRQHTNLSSRQLEFLNLLKGVIIEREKVEKKDLINAPFTVIHPQGIRGVFSPAEINEILQLTKQLAA
ncbi:type I restriction endonuclease subunit R [Acidithiobacillus concretivorus]|uniref:type I restriction endonuclease subunit R n=1 Tax=Acidithiobacillus concretivorus TaxID=3063952 RepID=UPI001C0780AB|nr:type I restriction endonuclease subunit R [Acidithiobacillus concretivorus]